MLLLWSSVVLIGARATAQPAQVTREELLGGLGVDEEAADYVILIDTSQSMDDSGLYEQVKGALRPLLGSLASRDHVAVLTFDTNPEERFSGVLGEPPADPLAGLPPADGADTDIGQAIERALDHLERPGALDVAVLVLVTDGLHDPGRGSVYETGRGPAWDALAARAEDLARRQHSISAYALALAPSTDAGLLSQVFPDTVVLGLPEGQLGERLRRVKEEFRIERARRIVAPDMEQGTVEVGWGDATDLDLGAGVGEIDLALHSTMAHVPLELTELSSISRGEVRAEAVLPGSVSLPPGQTVTIPVPLRFGPGLDADTGESALDPCAGFALGRRQVTGTGELTVRATVGSPWATALRDDLRFPDFSPALSGATTTALRAGCVTGLSLWWLPPLALLAWTAWYLFVGRRPTLRGRLLATVAGHPAQPPLALHGRRMRIGKGQHSRLAIPGRGTVRHPRVPRLVRRHGRDPGLRITYANDGGKRRTKTCRPHGSVALDGATFRYEPLRAPRPRSGSRR